MDFRLRATACALALLATVTNVAAAQITTRAVLEVWSRGATIRAYTHQFMERMAQRPVQLIPGW